MPMNIWAAVTRARRIFFNNEQVDRTLAKGPEVLSGEAVQAINAAGTGLVDLVKSSGGDVVIIPSAAGNQPVMATTITSISTAGNVTYTPAQCLGGVIKRDTNGSIRTDTLPSAAVLLATLYGAAYVGAAVGQSFVLTIKNTSGAANTLTVAAGSGGTISGTATIAQANARVFEIVFTNVTLGAEAYTAECIAAGAF